MNSKLEIKNYNLSIKPLTSIHIGSGIEIDKSDYLIVENEIYVISLPLLADLLSNHDKDKLISYIIDSRFEKFHEFLTKIANDNRQILIKSKIFKLKFSRSFIKNYNMHTPGIKTIRLFSRNPLKSEPIVPGSSIKGAIRTALLDFWVKENTITKKLRKCARPNFLASTFRTLKISDNLNKINTAAIYSERIKRDKTTRDKNTRNNIPQNVEIWYKKSSLHKLSLLFYPQTTNINPDIRKNTIIKACKSFYGNLLKQELYYLQKNHRDAYLRIEKRLIDDKNSFPIKLGWGSGRDSVIPKNILRKIKTKKYKRNLSSPKTFWATMENNNYYPLGWAIAELKEE